MTELQEVAETMLAVAPTFKTLDEAIAYVRTKMPDETPQVVDGVAWALIKKQRSRL